VSLKEIARKLRQKPTKEEKQLWQALRGRQFAGFKFRRQHITFGHILDFYCADAKLAIELDGFQHGSPEETQNDKLRSKRLAELGIEVLRFWNHQWKTNRDGCLLEIWNAVQKRTGVLHIMDNVGEQKFIPPDLKNVKPKERIGPSP
jgi:very-short-patch-repair endonuclease